MTTKDTERKEIWSDEQEQLGALFQFGDDKRELIGELTKVEPNVPMRKGTTTRYTIKDDDGTDWIVIGTAIINQKLSAAEVKDRVRILYLGKDHDTSTPNGKMKNFQVWVKAS